MGRTKGTYTLTSNIEPKVGAPLDARTVVPLKTDLTANGTFDYPYIGLSVFVKEDNKRYTLIGSDPTVEVNWREEGSGTSTSADHVTYDNRESGLESVNIQDAVDEVVDIIENLPSDDTWRNIKVNGTEKLGTSNTTGAVDFINGTNTTVSFDSSGNKIKIDAVDTTYEEATTSVAGLMSASDKTKLNGIAPGAEVNVQSDWDQTTTTADDYIKNKPTIPPAVAVKGNAETVYRTGNVNITKGNIGLGNVDNTSDATKKTNFTGSIASGNTGFVTGGDAYTALSGKLNTGLKGAANGLAELDADGKVPSSQLPSYVDDVIEVEDYAHLPITGVSGKIYVTLDTNLTYRWSGTGYTEISASLALGETSSTAYRGDRGKTAYNHATETKLSTATASGLYKVAGTAQGHIASLTAVQKSDITALGIPGNDTWRPVQDNLTSTSTTDALSANQGRLLANGSARDNTKVAKAGDTMTGLLTTNAGITTKESLTVQKKDDVEWTDQGTNEPAIIMAGADDKNFKFKFSNYGKNVDVGWDWTTGDGAGAFFRQANSPTSPGCFGFYARQNTTTSMDFIGYPDGKLLWNSKRVVTATNNTAVGSGTQPVYVDANGYVTATTYSLAKSVPSNADFTNTHRPIQVNGTQNLGNNTTALNLKNGTNITITADGGNVTIATSAEVNQNAFSNVKVGSTTVAADSKTDTLELVAGSNITLTPDATNDKITIAATDTNTTYTFAGGTNKFTVTPSGGTAQDVAITPSIANNITGSGTSGYIAKFNGTNTITNGPQLGSSTTTYLRNDGSWATPVGTTYTAGTGLTLDSGAFRTYVPRLNGSSDDSKTIPGVNRFNIREFGNSTLNFPYKEWYHLLTIEGGDNHYATQLALNMTNKAGVYYRKYDNSTWGDWYRLNGALIQKYQTVSTTNKWYKLFTISYSQYNYAYLHLLIKAGFENMYEVFLCLRFTPNGIGAADSYAKIIPYNSSSKNVRLYQVNDTTFGLAVNAQGATSQIGFELLDMASEANTLNAWSLTIANPFTELEAGPTAFGNHRYFTGNYADINGTPSLNYLPLAGGTMSGGITFNKVNNAIAYTGTKATYGMIKFIDNTGDEYGNGISIGGGGLTIIGGGESADAIADGKSGGSEMLYLSNDQNVQIITGVQNGLSSAKTFDFKTDGTATFDGKWVGRFTANPTSGQVVITDGTTGGMKSSGYTIATSVPSGAVFTDTKVTSSGNHYTPSTASGQDKSASATGATAAWSIDVVKGVTLNTDGKGHVTGISVTSGKIPANPVASNTITGSGTSGYIAKFNGTNTITNGPAFGSATTTYLRNDGNWATPENTKNTAGSTDTSSKIFLIGATSQAANPQTYSDDQVYTTSGTLQTNITNATAGVNANTANSSTAGGLSLYGTDPTQYGVIFRGTGNQGKHGYVQGDWATYFTMNAGSGVTNRGWVFRDKTTTSNVASISNGGNASFKGSVTVGGNEANTSGVRMVYDSTNECMNLEFAS